MPALFTGVDAAETLGGRCEHADYVVLVRDVALDQHVLDAAALNLPHADLDLFLGIRGLLGLAQVVDRHVGAVLREANRDRLADPSYRR